MMIHDSSVPFFLMANAGEFSPGRPSKDPKQEVGGLKQAIEATRKRIAEYKSSGANVSNLEFHLKNLEQRLQSAQDKIK